jgi:hypothetical protein
MQFLAFRIWRLVWIVLVLILLLLCGARSAYAGTIT